MRWLLFLLSLLLVMFSAASAQVKYKTVPVHRFDDAPTKKYSATNVAAKQPRNVVDVVYGASLLSKFAKMMKTTDGQNYRNGTYTIFAPSDSAMAHLPVGIAGKIYAPENNATTASIVDYHVLRGKFTDADIVAAVKKANGYAAFYTVSGKKVVFSMTGDYVKMMDEEGHVANIKFSHYSATNGMVHVIDKVMMPKG